MSDKANTHAKKRLPSIRNDQNDEVLHRYENPSHGVDTLLNSESCRIIENNQVIESLLKIVILCGKQGLALHGHRDDKINWNGAGSEDRYSNEGNFIELVRFCAETDPILHNHLSSAPRNATYTSKTIQNELVSVVGKSIQNEIIEEVKNTQFYSVIANEVIDTSNKELSLVFRYVA